MAVISVRLNKHEEHILNSLSDVLSLDKSSVIKQSLVDRYEEIEDLKTIDVFEKREKSSKTKYYSSDEILKELGKAK
mgnify:CR=1 FL=1